MAEHPRSTFWTVAPGEGVDLAIESKGVAAEKPETVGQVFKSTCQKFPNRPALRYKEGDTWIPVSYTEYYAHCVNTAKSMIKVNSNLKTGLLTMFFFCELINCFSCTAGP